MSTPLYPKLTATEAIPATQGALLTVAGDVATSNAEFKEVVVDAEFTTRLGLRSLKHLPLPFVGRFRTNAKVIFGAQRVRVRDLAERFLPGRARWYPKLKRYVKRLKVVLEEVGVIDLLLVWQAQGRTWHLTALVRPDEARG